MVTLYFVAAVICVALFGYLVFAMLFPESLS